MMFKKRKQKRIAAMLDGAVQENGELDRLLDDPSLRDYHNALLRLHQGAQHVVRAPEIPDARFNAFMSGIRAEMEAPQRRFMGWRAVASLSAAALVIVISLLVLFSNGAQPVRATEVESAITELQGVTIDLKKESRPGVPTVWVTMPEKDLW